ncbi:MAG TPA: hypothetical protein DGP39_06695, partial [Verrucomicrobiales bacterium]|nr:hypothetical protein [Verrucomicrobiales bacterium]
MLLNFEDALSGFPPVGIIKMKTVEPKNHWIISESLILLAIGINAAVLVLDGFPNIHAKAGGWLNYVDFTCLLYFILEACLKIRTLSFNGYWAQGWNKFDFLIVLGSAPLLLQPFIDSNLDGFSILLIGRMLRFLRIMRFVPNGEKIWGGVVRAIKASAAVFLTLAVLNIILAMGANVLFGAIAPDYFGDPIKAAYSLFKVFTIEGWYEIPDALDQAGLDASVVGMVKAYFIIAVLCGGILGLSLANAVFVDEMTADNNDKLEEMVSELRSEMASNRNQDNLEMTTKLQSIE